MPGHTIKWNLPVSLLTLILFMAMGGDLYTLGVARATPTSKSATPVHASATPTLRGQFADLITCV